MVAGLILFGGVIVIRAIFVALITAAQQTANAGTRAVHSTSQSITFFLGRASVAANLFIPEGLPAALQSRSRLTGQLSELIAWTPKLSAQPALRTAHFVSALHSVKHQGSTQILVEDIDRLLFALSGDPLEHLYDDASSRRPYPVAQPSRPDSIPKPPRVALADLTLPEPALELPYYQGRLAFLNSFVTIAHAKPVADYNEACTKRSDLLDWAAQFKDASALAQKEAERAWQSATDSRAHAFESLCKSWEEAKKTYEDQSNTEWRYLDDLRTAYENGSPESVANYVSLAIDQLSLPASLPTGCRASYHPDSKILILEHEFPNVLTLRIEQEVHLKKGLVHKPIRARERRLFVSRLQSALALRLISAALNADYRGHIVAIALNGIATFVQGATGLERRAYCLAVLASRADIQAMDISKVDPIAALQSLGGMHAGESYDVAPVTPRLELSHDDPRFIPGREVLQKLAKETNLAAMDWEDFEHLIRQLFEKAFAAQGAEVHITQASRDQGVDAVILDPDPLRGGKIIVQAKRYTNLVDVSAVRDLYGAVTHERAARGILVTTSDFGHESYSFAADKPLTLLNGQKLLGLLQQYGYTFRIDIDEARKMLGLER